MENKNANIVNMRRKILSLIGLIIFSLAFIFACLRKVFPFGNWIAQTFGFVTYPLFLISAFVELAKFLGLKYRRNVKSTILATLIVISLLCVIQSIATYKQLDLVASFNSFKEYIKYSYASKLTIVGGFGSILIGGLSMLLGAMGTIVAFVIICTISVGVLVDYEHYGKYDDERIKKLKSKAMREKVSNSDKEKTEDGKPVYGFSENDNIVGTIETDENELRFETSSENQIPTYSESDVIGEISDTTYYANDETEPSNPFLFSGSDDSLTEARREFMSGTYGNYQSAPIEHEVQGGFDYVSSVNTTPAYDTTFAPETSYGAFAETPEIKRTNDLWGDDSSSNAVELDDALKTILSQKEDEIESLSPDEDDVFENNNSSFEFESKQIEKNPFDNMSSLGTNPFENIQPEANRVDNNFESSFGTERDIEKRNGGILSNAPVQQKKEQPKPIIPSGNPIAMPGVRYNPPPLSLLQRPVIDTGNYSEEQSRKSKQLEDVLASFNVPAKVVNIVRGPKITRYELSVPLGISVKKIPSYELDIQSALSAKSVNIRAPIPGSSYVGIELENDTFTNVYERELLESPEFQNAKGPLPIVIGKDISGEIIVKSLAKMVHGLVAGSTGSGKSVFIHNIVLSLIYKYSPDDVRLVMIDPKQVEFGMYDGLPHLVAPKVVLGTQKAVSALKWCVQEMDRRFEIMGRANYKNIEDYNKSELVKSGQFEHFPYIVIIVDELAEIMGQYKKEAEPAIQRITQLARACGMHLIVAVQRPSVDIITGVIKNNISSRFAFRLQDSFASKTMLGTVGAEKLLGYGDMLLQLTDTSSMPRLQAGFAKDEEIKAVVDFVKRNNPAVFYPEAEKAFSDEAQVSDDSMGSDFVFADAPQSKGKVDEYFKVAVKSVMMSGSASVSYLQRRLSIGYSRAARIVDQMEEKGYIAPPTGAKTRKVLISPEQFREDFGEDYNS